MASIQQRTGGYQVRHGDPLGQQRARQFKRKVDAERFAGKSGSTRTAERGSDSKGAEGPRRGVVRVLRGDSVAGDDRDLSARSRQVRAARIRRSPARTVACRRGRAAAERDRCRHRVVVGAPSLPDAGSRVAGRSREGPLADEPVQPCAAAGGGHAEDDPARLGSVPEGAQAISRVHVEWGVCSR
jgi:hypothetical protein